MGNRSGQFQRRKRKPFRPFAACFATTYWRHGGAASRARLICSWKGVRRFLLVSWTNRSCGELREPLARSLQVISFSFQFPSVFFRIRFHPCLIWFRFCYTDLFWKEKYAFFFFSFQRFCLDRQEKVSSDASVSAFGLWRLE